MFTEISMKNFKSWRDTGPVRMAPLTAFFGANSSGKSSLLQMLLLLKQTAESNDRGLVLKTGSMQPGYVNLGTPQEITFGNERKLSLGFAWEFDGVFPVVFAEGVDDVPLRGFKFDTIIHAEEQKVYVDSFRYQQGETFKAELTRKPNNHYEIQVLVRGKEPRTLQRRPPMHMKPVKCYGFPSETSLYYRDAEFVRTLGHDIESLFQQLYYLGPLREYPQRTYSWSGEKPATVGLRGELAIHALLAGERYANDGASDMPEAGQLRTRIGEWLDKLGLASSFEVRPLYRGSHLYEVRLKHVKSSPEALLPDMGIGVSQVLPVLVLCYYVPEGSTIILEQPELHLHPSVQAGLADVFIHAMKKRNIQIIVESHSEHFLRRLQRRIAEEVVCPDDAALYFCEMCGGESKLRKLDVDDFGNIHDWPEDFFGDLVGEMVAALDAGLQRQEN